MPKNKKTIKSHDGAITVINPPSKLLIGTRKGGISATSMSTAKLQDVLQDKSKKRYWNNARTALRNRGASLESM